MTIKFKEIDSEYRFWLIIAKTLLLLLDLLKDRFLSEIAQIAEFQSPAHNSDAEILISNFSRYYALFSNSLL